MDHSFRSQSSNVTQSASDLQSSSDSGGEYAWLVHSQNTLRDTLPPSVDNKPLARQRRRRTSPEDQAILEAEYTKNSKPDKYARRAIVDRVAGMGEKEVQIWFQNRRQNSRRRTQPPGTGEAPPNLEVEDSLVAVPDGADESQYPYSDPLEHASASQITSTDMVPSSQADEVNVATSSLAAQIISSASSELIPIKDRSSSRSLKRTSSGIRISLTSEGGAKLVQENESSPSPPRPEQHLKGLIDPTSPMPALELDFSTSQPGSRVQSRHRGPSGRSRDSRSWEFWCDNDSRNELALKAKQEESGSASDAISLMRSQSSRSALSNLERSSWLKRGDSMKQNKRARPSFGRSSTTVDDSRFGKSARFELFEDSAVAKVTSKNDRYLRSPGGDSDKENFDPNAPRLPLNRRPLGDKGTIKPGLRKTKTAPSQPARSRTHQSTKRRGHPHETDEELQQFMSSTGPGISSEDDLNCVQSLLYLSQGH